MVVYEYQRERKKIEEEKVVNCYIVFNTSSTRISIFIGINMRVKKEGERLCNRAAIKCRGEKKHVDDS